MPVYGVGNVLYVGVVAGGFVSFAIFAAATGRGARVAAVAGAALLVGTALERVVTGVATERLAVFAYLLLAAAAVAAFAEAARAARVQRSSGQGRAVIDENRVPETPEPRSRRRPVIVTAWPRAALVAAWSRGVWPVAVAAALVIGGAVGFAVASWNGNGGGAQPAPSAVLSSALVSRIAEFEPPEAWQGGWFVKRRRSGKAALMLTSVDGSAASASLPVSRNLSLVAPRNTALEMWVHVDDADAFDNKVWASRIAFERAGSEVIAWLDRADRSGWNKLQFPLVELVRTGRPQANRVKQIRVTVHSKPRTRVSVTFDRLTITKLERGTSS